MSEEDEESPSSGLTDVMTAIAFGGALVATSEDFNTATEHVHQLLDDAVALFERGSFGSAAFLAITALEETSKAHIGMFRRDGTRPRPEGRDPLRDHASKHRLAMLPTVFMSDRIIEALGRERADALRAQVMASGFTALREAGIYCARSGDRLVSPKEIVPPPLAWEFIVLAIEAADDALIGSTNRSFEVGERFDALFASMLPRKPAGEPDGGSR